MRQGLDIDNFFEDCFFERRLDGSSRNQIHLPPKKLAQKILQSNEVEKADRGFKFHENVNIASLVHIVPRHGTKETQTLDVIASPQ